METFPVKGSFVSPLLKEHCGFDVTVTVDGIVRRPLGTEQLEIANIDWVATRTGTNKTVRFRNVSAAVESTEPDGTVIVNIQGHKPEFSGRAKINPATGEVVQDAQQTGNLDRICELLSG